MKDPPMLCLKNQSTIHEISLVFSKRLLFVLFRAMSISLYKKKIYNKSGGENNKKKYDL